MKAVRQCKGAQDRSENKGFSLLEVLVCIAILALISVPILKGFETSALYNKKANETQQVTAFAQGVTEHVTSMDKDDFVKQLETAGGSLLTKEEQADKKAAFLTAYPQEQYNPQIDDIFTAYTYEQKDITISGKQYDMTVRYDPLPYSDQSATGGSAAGSNLQLAANIGAVDGMCFPVISHEINRYEGAEQNVSAVLLTLLRKLSNEERRACEAYCGIDQSHAQYETILLSYLYHHTKKDVLVTIRPTDGGSGISINCDITYTFTGLGKPVELTYNVYQAKYGLETDTESGAWTKGGKIYLFAKAWHDTNRAITDQPLSNTITIRSEYTGAKKLEVYLVRGYDTKNDSGGGASTVIKQGLQFDRVVVEGSVYSAIGNASLAPIGEQEFTSLYLYTNIKGSFYDRVLTAHDMESAIGIEQARLRCYEVTVSVIEQESGAVAAHIVTTKREDGYNNGK